MSMAAMAANASPSGCLRQPDRHGSFYGRPFGSGRAGSNPGAHGMRGEKFAQERESEGCGEASLDRFHRTIAALKESWTAEARRAPFYPFVAWTREGPRLGAATLLARKGAGEEGRFLAMLSVAHASSVPANALKASRLGGEGIRARRPRQIGDACRADRSSAAQRKRGGASA